MNMGVDEHKRTMAFGEIALRQIKALRQPAVPRSYEIWYTYATGYRTELNERINELIKRNGTISYHELEQIYGLYLSPVRLSERINDVGSQVVGEIDQVMAMIENAAGSASSYSESLADTSTKLSQSKDRESLRAIVESLVQTAKEMEASNRDLEANLSASRHLIIELQGTLDAVRNESLTDPLTQLPNRKFFDSTLEKAVVEAKRKKEPLSLMMIDVDHFKSFNDNFGHLTGDEVLKLVASTLKQNIKGQDTVARYGGEEFMVILPNTVMRSAIVVAEHIRRLIMGRELLKRSTGECLGRITVSVGIATLHDTDNTENLIERTDSCLYVAKQHGRNRLMSETDPEVSTSGITPAQVA